MFDRSGESSADEAQGKIDTVNLPRWAKSNIDRFSIQTMFGPLGKPNGLKGMKLATRKNLSEGRFTNETIDLE